MQEVPPPAATDEHAREVEGLGVVVGGTVLSDVGENVVDAGPGAWVDERLRDAHFVWITETKYKSKGEQAE